MGKEVKITVVGNSNVGKTCMCISYCTNSFPQDYVSTVFDNYNAKAVVDGNPVDLVLFDTAGDAEYDSIRSLNYPGTNVFLICFSVVDVSSAEGIVKKWVEEVKGKCPDTPIVLVGTKIDLRKSDKVKNPITKEQGDQFADAVGAQKFLECSALTQEGLGKVFEESVKLVLYPPKTNPKMDKDKIEKLQKGGCLIQ